MKTTKTTNEPAHRCSHPAYRDMLHRARRFLTSFRADLTKHDRRALEVWGREVPFVWAVRPSGTHIFRADRKVDRRHTAADLVGSVESSFAGEEIRWYAWDGHALRPVSSDDARAFARRAFEQALMTPVEQIDLNKMLKAS